VADAAAGALPSRGAADEAIAAAAPTTSYTAQCVCLSEFQQRRKKSGEFALKLLLSLYLPKPTARVLIADGPRCEYLGVRPTLGAR
jgi:hypothetical protein